MLNLNAHVLQSEDIGNGKKLVPLVPIITNGTKQYFATSGVPIDVYVLDGVEYVSPPLKFGMDIPLALVTAREGTSQELTATIDPELCLLKIYCRIGDLCLSQSIGYHCRFKESKDGLSMKQEIDVKFYDLLESSRSGKYSPLFFRIDGGIDNIQISMTVKGEVRLDTGRIRLDVVDYYAKNDTVDLTPYMEFLGYRLDGAKVVNK